MRLWVRTSLSFSFSRAMGSMRVTSKDKAPGRIPCSPILAMHELKIHPEMFMHRVRISNFTGNPEPFLAHKVSPCTDPPSTPREIQISCACLKHQSKDPICLAHQSSLHESTGHQDAFMEGVAHASVRSPSRSLSLSPLPSPLSPSPLSVSLSRSLSLLEPCKANWKHAGHLKKSKVPCPPINPGSTQSDFRVGEG